MAAQLPILQGKLTPLPVQTNILFTDIDTELAAQMLPYLAQRGVALTASNYQTANGAVKRVRWVCHLDISSTDIDTTLQHISTFAQSN